MSTFAKLLRNSNFVNFGSFDGCYVVGQVVHRVKDTLFIDFDSKFNAICQRPRENAEKYLIGSSVVIHLHDTELSERFLGSKHDLTLMEADAQLLGLFRPRRRDLMRKMGETIKPEEIRLCVRR